MIGFNEVNPRTYDWEAKDCAVRASSIALDRPYHEVHAEFKKAGRKDRQGTYFHVINSVLGDPEFATLYTREAPTLNQFANKIRRGRWVLCNRRHAWALIDGVVHDDWKVGARTRVLIAWRVK